MGLVILMLLYGGCDMKGKHRLEGKLARVRVVLMWGLIVWGRLVGQLDLYCYWVCLWGEGKMGVARQGRINYDWNCSRRKQRSREFKGNESRYLNYRNLFWRKSRRSEDCKVWSRNIDLRMNSCRCWGSNLLIEMLLSRHLQKKIKSSKDNSNSC